MINPPNSKRSISLVLFYLAVIAVAAFGVQFQPGEWYVGLQKSSLTPPNIVFPIVWTILYALMPLSIWNIYLKVGGTPAFRFPANLFFIQLGLNGIWTYLFFGLHRPELALVDIIVLWVMILWMIMAYGHVSVRAAALQVPYLLWVTFAALLNYQIWVLN
ncbi:MAG: TspO/MBR family protein [Gammaproteobacteria bacterium]